MAANLNRPITREVEGGRYGPLLVELTDRGIVLREKGRRQRTMLQTWVALYERGLKLCASQPAPPPAPVRHAPRKRMFAAGRLG